MSRVSKSIALLLIVTIAISILIAVRTVPAGIAQSGASVPALTFEVISGTVSFGQGPMGYGAETIGELLYNGAGIPNAQLKFSYRAAGEATWQGLTYENTSSDGSYGFWWAPSISTHYVINVTWSGNNVYSGVTAIGYFATTAYNSSQNQYIFSVASNSTFSGLTFDQTTNELSFSVNGPSGTTGYSQVCAPTALFAGNVPFDANVTVDGTPLNGYEYQSENNDYWSMDFTYNNGAHAIDIAFGPTSTSITNSTGPPSMKLDPSVGSVGTAVAATLSGFPAYVSVLITFGTINVGTITSTTGSGTVYFTVPQVPNGMYNVTATGAQGGVATQFFFVGQAVTTSPTPTPMPTSSLTPSPSPVLTPTPGLPTPTLSFYCISSTTTTGFNVQIQGSLTYKGVGLSGAGIQFSDSVTGGATWQDLAYVITGNDGGFSVSWYPSASGNDIIRASWAGDGLYSAASITVNFAVAPFNNQGQNVFSVTSNSTLTSLTFDSKTNELSFGVSGPSGTTGFTQVCIPQSLIPDISKLTVMLDGAPINYTSVSEGNVWLLTFVYHHSSHTVVIELESSSVPELSWLVVVPLLLSVFSVAVIVRHRKIVKKSSSP